MHLPRHAVAASIGLVLALGFGPTALAAPRTGPGFLVIAPDRGYVGNEEIREAWRAFGEEHLTRLVFVSLAEDYETAVRDRLRDAVAELRAEGSATPILVPLVVSDADPHLAKVRAFPETAGLPVAPVFGRDPLAGQILEDRARALARMRCGHHHGGHGAHHGEERPDRLVVVGFGATSRDEADAMARDLASLAAGVRLPCGAADPAVAVFYASGAPGAAEGNRLAEATVRAAVEDATRRALVIPFHFGFKHTASMQFGRRLEALVGGHDVGYDGREILPDPLVARWLRKVASRYVPVRREQLGVVVMPHGAGEYLNAPILAAVEPLRSRYNVEVAFGMADVDTLQPAIDRLEARGARRILVLRLYDTPRSLKADTEYVLGLTDVEGPMGMHHGHGGGPSRVRSGALLFTAGGLGADPLIAEVLLERILEVSREPSRETVILLAHGAGSDEDDRLWLEQLAQRAEQIRARAPVTFRAIEVATVREDWPDKRAAAVARVRRMVEEGTRDGGRVLVISNRISGPGPYRRLLSGLDYVLNDRGIAPHPNLTRWMEAQIDAWMRDQLAASGAGAASAH